MLWHCIYSRPAEPPVTNIFVTHPPPGILPACMPDPPMYVDILCAEGGFKKDSHYPSGYELLDVPKNIYDIVDDAPPVPPEKDDIPPASPAPEKPKTKPKPQKPKLKPKNSADNDYLQYNPDNFYQSSPIPPEKDEKPPMSPAPEKAKKSDKRNTTDRYGPDYMEVNSRQSSPN